MIAARILLLGLAVWGLGLGFGSILTACQREPAPRAPEDLERDYIVFIHTKINPMVEREKLTHLAGGCDVDADGFLCVECYRPYGEVWVRCSSRSGCALLDTGPELDAAGADLGVCERPQARHGLALSFTRRRP